MASRTDMSDLLSSCRWAEEGSYLGEIAKSGFPVVAKVSRGQYQNIGQPSFSNPSLVSHVLLVSGGKKLSIAAQCVKFKNARQRVVPFGPTLSIPQDFIGHFEILSEDGRAVPCIQTVSALTRKFPDACLVRETLKAYKPDAKSTVVIPPLGGSHQYPTKLSTGDPPDSSVNNLHGLIQPSYKISDKTRLIQPGEILVLVGEVSVPTGKKVSRFLRCFDSKGQTVYLNSAQKGKFSPLARQDSISGVHTTKNILTKRLPLMVRLVDGKSPVMPSAKTSSFKFVPELRLFSTIQDELIFAMPLSQSWKESLSLVPLPLTVPLKFQICRNMGEVEHSKEFSRVHEKIKSLVEQSSSLIQIYDINLKKELRFDGRQWKAYAPPLFLTPSSSTPDAIIPASGQVNNGISSTPSENICPQSEKNSGTIVSGSACTYDEIPDAQDYEDIDEIYDYVRGIKPPPPRLLSGQNNVDSTGNNVITSNNEKNNKDTPLRLDCAKATQYQKGKNSCHKSSHHSKNNGKSAAYHHHHVHNTPSHDKLSGVPTSPTTIVTITTPPGHNEPDLIVASVPPPPVPKHRVPYGRLLSSKSLERLDASDSEYDEPPPPPPIETIPSKQNLFFLNPPGGVSVSVSNKNSKNLSKTESDGIPTTTTKTDDETGITNEIHNNGGSVQIQIRSSENPQKAKTTNGPQLYGCTTSNSAGVVITPSSTGRENLHGQTGSHGHHSHHHLNSYPYNLGSTGNSINTTPTNTSGSGGSYGSSSSGGDIKKGKPKQHLYVKHNSMNSSSQNHCTSPLAGGILATDASGKGLSGSPANRIVFRRSPIFDCRYKSMNDLNRSSLESGGSMGGGGGQPGAVGSHSQRHRCYPHSGSQQGFNVSVSNVNSIRDGPVAGSGLNLNLNLLNLNMNLKASGKNKGIFRPKSLTNLVFNEDSYHGGGGNGYGSSGSGGGLIGGVKKKLTDMVVPSHHHAAHTPPPPPIEILQKVPIKCSQRTRKTSTPQHSAPALYL